MGNLFTLDNVTVKHKGYIYNFEFELYEIYRYQQNYWFNVAYQLTGPSRDLKFNRLILFLIKGQGRYWHLALLIWHIWHYIDVDIFLKVNPDTIVEVWKDGFHTELSIITFHGYKTLLSSCWYLSDISYGIDWPKYYNCDPHNFIGTYHSTCTFVGWLF